MSARHRAVTVESALGPVGATRPVRNELGKQTPKTDKRECIVGGRNLDFLAPQSCGAGRFKLLPNPTGCVLSSGGWLVEWSTERNKS